MIAKSVGSPCSEGRSSPVSVATTFAIANANAIIAATVTIAATVAFVFASANVAAALTGNDLSTADGNASAATAVTSAMLLLAGIGMLLRRYWAVLGFQTILALQIIFFSLALLRVQKWWLAILMTIAIGLLGWLFWKLIRAMARLQMPDRESLLPPREP